MSDSLLLHGLYSPRNSLGQNTGVGSLSLLQGIFPTLGIKPRSPALQADSSPAEPQVKPKNTGVGSGSFLQQIFPTQELNQGLLHCRWILYQLNYQGALFCRKVKVKVIQLCLTFCNPMDHTVHGILQARRGAGSLSLLHGIFPTQGSNPSLPHCRQILHQLSHKGSTRILEWVAYLFSSGSS